MLVRLGVFQVWALRKHGSGEGESLPEAAVNPSLGACVRRPASHTSGRDSPSPLPWIGGFVHLGAQSSEFVLVQPFQQELLSVLTRQQP